MNTTLTAALLSIAFAGAASAQVFTPAPVPNRNFGSVYPSERVSRPDGAERSAPFAGLPHTLGSTQGSISSAVQGISDRNDALPSVSR